MGTTNGELPCPKIVRGQVGLTPEQEEYARQFAHERIAAVLSTAAIDEREAEECLWQAYRVAGLEPVPVRWFDSPLPFVRANAHDLGDRLADSCDTGHIVGNSVAERVRKSIQRNSLWDSVWNSVRGSIEADVWESVGWIAEGNVTESVGVYIDNGAGVYISGVEVDGRIIDSLQASAQAYEDESWLSCYRFFHEVFEENDLIHMARFNEMVSGYWLGSQEAWLVRKPLRLERDEQGRLHSADGMAIQYRDGWGCYAWHGVLCSETLILHPEQIDEDDWLSEDNLEVRRAIQERLGPDRFVELVGGTCIDRGTHGDLIEVELEDDPEDVARYVHVKDASTQRRYYLRVPPAITSADAAVAWTFGLDEDAYRPLQET